MSINDYRELSAEIDRGKGVAFLLSVEPKLYRSWPAISQSELKVIADHSPQHLMHQRKYPRPETDPQRLGTAAHMAILEPLRFLGAYDKEPKVNKRTKAGKEELAALEADAKATGRKLLPPKDYQAAMDIRDAVRSSAQVSALVEGGVAERASFGRLYGSEVKILTDFYKPSDHAIVDVKTTKSAAPWQFERDVRKYRYHWQACFYTDTVEFITGKAPTFHILAIENHPPYASSVFTFGFDLLAIARREIKEAIQTIANCQENDVWPGYSTRIHELKSRKWEWEEHMKEIVMPGAA